MARCEEGGVGGAIKQFLIMQISFLNRKQRVSPSLTGSRDPSHINSLSHQWPPHSLSMSRPQRGANTSPEVLDSDTVIMGRLRPRQGTETTLGPTATWKQMWNLLGGGEGVVLPPGWASRLDAGGGHWDLGKATGSPNFQSTSETMPHPCSKPSRGSSSH